MSELIWVDECSPLTPEEWDRIIAWHRKRVGRFFHPTIIIDPVLPDDTIKIGDVTLTNIQIEDKGQD